ncbi:MAG TPA: hypothetical protein VFS22_10165 [Flavisolibacter sp.]|nr:hypothetical protein [Flavisolibacter sp.]
MPFLPSDIDAFNRDVDRWTKVTKNSVVSEMDNLGIVHRENSRSPVPAKKALKTSQRKASGITNRISFRMPRHMVFVHKGVGRGTKITDVGTTNRRAKPWFNPVIEKRMEELVQTVADHQGTMVLNAVLIR